MKLTLLFSALLATAGLSAAENRADSLPVFRE
jgi:hypothetical protein